MPRGRVQRRWVLARAAGNRPARWHAGCPKEVDGEVGTCGVASGEAAQAAVWQRCHGARSARADEQTTTRLGNEPRTLKHPHGVRREAGRRSETTVPSGGRYDLRPSTGTRQKSAATSTGQRGASRSRQGEPLTERKRAGPGRAPSAAGRAPPRRTRGGGPPRSAARPERGLARSPRTKADADR